MARYHSAEIVKDQEGRQYHIGVAPGELADTILLCGDLQRAERVARRFDKVELERREREYHAFTGSYQGMRLSIMSTGIGADNTEIAVIEISQCVRRPTFIRIGSCGALQPEIKLGDLVISSGAVRMESTSTCFVPDSYPAVAHHEVVLALLEAANRLHYPWHLGITATAAGFYGAQGRTAAGFTPRHPGTVGELERMGVKNFEMEASCLFTLASLRGYRAGAVCAVYAARQANRFVTTKLKETAEKRCIETGLEAALVLEEMRKHQGNRRLWLPSHGVAKREVRSVQREAKKKNHRRDTGKMWKR